MGWEQHYLHIKEVKYRGHLVKCGIARMAFTTGLFWGLDEMGYIGRWCFHTMKEAEDILRELEEIPDNLLIDGNWIKHKGIIEIRNPNYE